MPHHLTVLYPNEPDATFDVSYYLSTHIPLVSKHLSKHGLTGWDVVQYSAGPNGERPPYSISCTLVFETAEKAGAGLASAGGKLVADDISNFSNKAPVILGGKLLETQR